MALIGEMKFLTIGDDTYSVPSSGGGGGGTVTSVQVQATSPVQSSNSAAQSAVLNTTISLANGYGDTKNPYASKSKNLVLATPASESGVPSFRALDASDIPDLSDDYLPANTSIPTKTSDLTNDSGFITGYTETDPTVPSWAKQSSKPTYTASEVGALPSTTVIPSAGTGTSYPAMDGTKSLGTQAGFARVDHVHPTDTSRVPTSRTVNGKALSSNITLSASDVGAQETLVSGTNIKTVNGTSILGSGDIPISGGGGGTVTSVGVSNATNGGLSVSGSPVTGSGTITVGHSNVLTSAQTTQAVYPIKIDKNGHISAYGTAVTSMPASDVSAWAKAASKPTYTASEVGALPSSTSIPSKTSDLTNDSDFVEDASYVHTDNNFTTTLKNKLNGIAEGAEVNVQANWSQTTTTADDYIKNKPTIPTTTSQLTNNSGFITSAALPTKVSDLDNDSGFITSYTETDPTVPAWAKASSKPSYTASEVGAVPTSRTVNGKALSSNITLSASDVSALPASTSIPSKTSDLTNDSGFITGYTETDPTVPSWAKASTKPTYTASEVGAVSLTDGFATDSELLDATTIAIWEDILEISEE